mmetsp:Transcript_13302/g.26262  ORF Transcript_13302/g.26262 Transcript_13302/m.26262 type:complete len:359 (+) Transcript_13302:503-1579(+)
MEEGHSFLQQHQRALRKFHGLHERLLRCLEVPVIPASEPRDHLCDLLLKGKEDSSICSHDLKQVVVLFLGHDRAACHEFIRKPEERELLLGEHHDVYRKSGADHHGSAERVQNSPLEHSPREPAVERVALNTREPELLCGHFPVQLEVVDPEPGSTAQRILVDGLPHAPQRRQTVLKCGGEGVKPEGHGGRHRLLHMGVPRHGQIPFNKSLGLLLEGVPHRLNEGDLFVDRLYHKQSDHHQGLVVSASPCVDLLPHVSVLCSDERLDRRVTVLHGHRDLELSLLPQLENFVEGFLEDFTFLSCEHSDALEHLCVRLAGFDVEREEKLLVQQVVLSHRVGLYQRVETSGRDLPDLLLLC